MKVKLSKPLKTTTGKTLNELDLDLDSLTGEDLLAIEQEMSNDTNPLMASLDISRAYYVRVAARACGMAWQELRKLNIKDFTAVTRAVSNFLYNSDSDQEAAVEPADNLVSITASSATK